MLDIANDYIGMFGNRSQAMAAFVQDLERGDATTYKQGYSHENAVAATADAFGTDRTTVELVLSEHS